MYQLLHLDHQRHLIDEEHNERHRIAGGARGDHQQGIPRGDGGSIRIRLRARQRARSRGSTLDTLGLTRTPGLGRRRR